MAQQPNRLLRIVVPLILVLVGIGAAAAVFVNSSKSANRQPPPVAPVETAETETNESKPIAPAATPDQQTAEKPALDGEPDTSVADQSGQPESNQPETHQPDASAQPVDESVLAGLRARVQEAGAYDAIGGIEADGPERMKLHFSDIGAGISSLRLASEFDNIQSATDFRQGKPVGEEHHVQLQYEQISGSSVVTPFAALWIEVEGKVVSLVGRGVWKQISPGSFEAVVENEAGEELLRLRRSYILTSDTNDLRIEQRIANVSGQPLDVRFVQFGPIDLPKDAVTYGGDKRRVRFGYLLRPELDTSRSFVQSKNYLTPRANVLSPKDPAALWQDPQTGKTYKPYVASRQIWPDERAANAGFEIVWAAMTNRYYGVAVHTVDQPGQPLTMESIEKIDRVVLQEGNGPDNSVLVLRLTGKKQTIAPGQSASDGLMIYAGPKSKAEIAKSPAAAAAGVKELVVYNFGGPCAFCTFTWLSDPLLGLIRFLHTFTHDWSIAIILLVFIVRGVLHPINRWSQIRMQRFGKQMTDLQPKQKKIQEKYAGDRQKIQQEMAKLWKEEGVNPAGMLGCLPMMLQSPIWIALYASLYFLYELRQQPAFFGLFQTISGGAWPFMADLSEPDHFIPLGAGAHFTLPLMGVIKSINILPLMLGVVFFMHQKFLTPPTAATLSPEQQSQQKMIKIMTVVMFPFIMYNAPSGLALYFIANSTIAIVENSWIRAHIKKHDLLEVTKKPRKERRQGSFMSRLQQIADKQQAIREQQKRIREGGPGAPKKPGGESAAQRAMRKGRNK